jgi:hypothetical protein
MCGQLKGKKNPADDRSRRTALQGYFFFAVFFFAAFFTAFFFTPQLLVPHAIERHPLS